MQNRRGFLSVLWRCLATLSLTPLLVRCGILGDDETDRSFVSELASAHTHVLLIPGSVLTAPSSIGWSGVTSESAEHTHDVDLTGAELENIARRVRFTTVSQSEDGHEHVFDFKI